MSTFVILLEKTSSSNDSFGSVQYLLLTLAQFFGIPIRYTEERGLDD